jgi:hypothetical protein
MLRFRTAALFAATAALALSAQAAHAGPPKELYNKSVVMSWSTGYNWKDTNGSSGHIVTNFARSIYISNAGRIFSMVSKSNSFRGRATGVSAAKASGPGGDVVKTSNHHTSGVAAWNGRELVGVVKVESGAFHLHVKFDEGFRSCTLSFTSGKEEGAPGIVKKSMRGTGDKLVMLNPTGNSGMNCAVKDGNVFE